MNRFSFQISNQLQMEHTVSKPDSSTTTLTDFTKSGSFVYEDLISKVQAIQQQMIEGVKYLDDQTNNDKEDKRSIEISFIYDH